VCNASNHRPDCRCGWGGDGHLGVGGGNSWSAQTTWGGGASLDSPNAQCPVCAEAVYFIRPQNGGAVWFDHLGPPWPKHPCMDIAEQRRTYPQPLQVPHYRNRASPPAYWSSHFDDLVPGLDKNRGCWVVYVDGVRVLMSTEPDPALSPVYLRWDGPDSPYGEVQYLATREGHTTLVEYRVFARRRSYRVLRFIKKQIDQADWQILQRWIEDLRVVDAHRVDELVQDLRDKTDWLLDPGWTRSEAGPQLVSTQVKKLCLGIPGLDHTTVFKWMCLFLD
jgi:hypothetical protein